MAAFTIPSIFTAIDKFSAPVRAMGQNVQAFASKAETAVSRGERVFRKLTPTLGEASKQFLSFLSTATLVAGVVGGITFSIKSLKDYETGMATLSSITGVTGKAFVPFKAQVNSVAQETKKSAIEVAKAFEIVGSAKAELLGNAEALGAVTKAAITLSKASGDDLAASAANVTGIMNQFTLGADQAERAINVLAAGSVVGAANITQINDSMTNFGAVAAGANITLEQSVALVETMGQKSLFGAEAGTKLRGSILKLQQAGVGYKSGQFQINDALEEARKKIDKLKTAKEKDAAVLKMFGAENITTGKILLDNIDTFKKFTEGVTGTNTANEQAAINTNTLSYALEEAKAAWVNMITGSDGATSSLETAKKAIRFVTNNLGTIVSVATKFVIVLVAMKTILLVSRTALIAYNVVLGISSALQGTASIAVGKNAVALGAYKAVLGITTTAQWALNAAMEANPIGLIIAALVALAAAVYAVYKHYQLLEEIYQKSSAAAKENAIKKETKAVEDLSAKYEKMGLSAATAKERATGERVQALDKAQVVLAGQVQQDFAKMAAAKGGMFGGITSFLTGDKEQQDFNVARGALGAAESAKAELLNPKKMEQDAMSQTINKNIKEAITVDFKNVPAGTTITGTNNSLDQVKGKTSSTMQ